MNEITSLFWKLIENHPAVGDADGHSPNVEDHYVNLFSKTGGASLFIPVSDITDVQDFERHFTVTLGTHEVMLYKNSDRFFLTSH